MKGCHPFFMLKHKLIQVTDGGYFYRFYPKLSSPNSFSRDTQKSIQRDLFNPLEAEVKPSIVNSVYGQFQEKYEEKGKYFIRLLSKFEQSLTCLLTSKIEIRTLFSLLEIQVEKDFYNYPFDNKKVYSITVDEIIEL